MARESKTDKYPKNELMLQGFEYHLPIENGFYKGMHFWDYIREHAQYYHDALGVTQIWLPPAYKGEKGFYSVGYDVYDRYDLGEFERRFADDDTTAGFTDEQKKQTRYGLKYEYINCIKALQDAGIKVYSDMVMNHMMGGEATEEVMVEQYDMRQRSKKISEVPFKIEAWTVYNYPNRNGAYSKDTWSKEDFNSVDYDQIRQNANDPQLFLFQGKSFNQDVDYENENYDYLMGCNIDMNRQTTVDKLYRWARWYMNETGVDGFRLDAVKHISSRRMRELIDGLRGNSGNDFSIVGEYWSPETMRLDKYLTDVTRTNFTLFDVPLHMALYHASVSNGQYDMRNLFTNSLLRNRPQNAVTFVDNHDTQPLESLESWVKHDFKPQAYSLLLYQKDGIPCVFYGDLYGMKYSKVIDGVLHQAEEEPVENLALMCKIRRECAYGSQLDYYQATEYLSEKEEEAMKEGDQRAIDKYNHIQKLNETNSHLIGYTRSGYPRYYNSGMAVLVTNGKGGSMDMYISTRYAGQTFVNALKPDQRITLNKRGIGTFYVDDNSAAVWIRETAYNDLLA